MQASASVTTLRSVLPRGQTLPDDVFRFRHRWIQRLLWFHVVGIPLFALTQGISPGHSLLEGVPLLVIAGLARLTDDRRLCASLMAIGLLTSSALLVHVWDGAIEAHFHFFVMIPVLALYEDWIPFLLAVAYVGVHHGLAGALSPDSVYNHQSAQDHPWRWAGIHGLFVAAAGAVAITSWRMNEQVREQTRVESFRRAEAEAVADALGRGLRPDQLPALEQGNVAARYRPAGAREIGGDWYDVLPLPDGRVVLTLGDVAGHGVNAASSMAGLRHSVRAYAHEGLSPSEVAGRIDRFFQGEFATFVYAVYDPAAGELRFANAGHLPPLLVSPAGEPRFLEEWRCTPLGLEQGLSFEEGVVSFPVGSTIVIYTDGLIERRGAGIEAQLRRLRSALDGCTGDAEEACDRALRAFPPDGSDDVAMLAFQAVPMSIETFTVPPHAAALSGARDQVRAWLAGQGTEASVVHDLVLAADEAIANAIEHSRSSRAPVVELTQVRDEIHVTVRDFGHWRGSRDDADRGRGLMVVEALTDRYDIVTTDSGTTVTMMRRIDSAAAAPDAGAVVGDRA